MMLCFARRCLKEMLRDPLTVLFGIGFPVVVLLLLSLIQANIPVELFALPSLTPGIAVFGLSFISLFSAQLISRDRTTAFMLRLYTSPMRAADFILGYTLPLLPLSIVQMAVCFVVAMILGLPFSWNVFLTIVVLIPTALVFIALGLLCGSIMNEKQVGGLCGALLTNLSAWLSGTWFSLDLMGRTFRRIAFSMPFARAVEAGRAVMRGDLREVLPDLIWVICWAIVLCILAVICFRHKMRDE
ncbi:MAG: ABC transporter permease [Ruminococcaceae bacterium]|nr:ABC transporter permease [Oscillospiraceae bacterium]